MLIRIGYEIVFEIPAPVPILLVLSTHADRSATIRRPGGLRIEPEVPVETYVDRFGNHCGRIMAPAGLVRLWDDAIVEDSGLPD